MKWQLPRLVGLAERGWFTLDGRFAGVVLDLDPPPAPTRARIGWAKPLARVFAIDVSLCRRCGGAVRVLAAITDADEIARVLHGARPPPQPWPPEQLSFLSL